MKSEQILDKLRIKYEDYLTPFKGRNLSIEGENGKVFMVCKCEGEEIWEEVPDKYSLSSVRRSLLIRMGKLLKPVNNSYDEFPIEELDRLREENKNLRESLSTKVEELSSAKESISHLSNSLYESEKKLWRIRDITMEVEQEDDEDI